MVGGNLMSCDCVRPVPCTCLQDWARSLSFVLQEASICMSELQSSKAVTIFITEAINFALERSSEDRKQLGRLFAHLVKKKQCTLDHMVSRSAWIIILYDVSIFVHKKAKYIHLCANIIYFIWISLWIYEFHMNIWFLLFGKILLHDSARGWSLALDESFTLHDFVHSRISLLSP